MNTYKYGLGFDTNTYICNVIYVQTYVMLYMYKHMQCIMTNIFNIKYIQTYIVCTNIYNIKYVQTYVNRQLA